MYILQCDKCVTRGGIMWKFSGIAVHVDLKYRYPFGAGIIFF